MENKQFWAYFLIGAIVGIIVGLMKNELAIWLGVGAGIGFLIAVIIEKKIRHKVELDKIMFLGVFMLFPILFFANQVRETFWYDVFGILAVIGAMTVIINFVKIIRKKKTRKKKTRKKK